jgi:hypothetical protein
MSKCLSELELAQESIEVVPSMKCASTIKSLRLSQDYESLTDVKQVITEVTIGKPNRQTFFRVHPEWKSVYPILELKVTMKSEYYIVAPDAATEIDDEVHPRLLVPVITRDGRLYIWPLRVGNGEQLDQAAASSLAAMQVAKNQWIKLVWKGHSFGTFTAKKDPPSPEWPEISFDEMLEIAFKDRIIDSPDHVVIKSLIGDE